MGKEPIKSLQEVDKKLRSGLRKRQMLMFLPMVPPMEQLGLLGLMS